MTVSADTVVRHNPERASRKYLKGIVVEPDLTLNESAADLYERFDGVLSLAEVCANVVEMYDVDLETLLADAVPAVQEMVNEGAVLEVEVDRRAG